MRVSQHYGLDQRQATLDFVDVDIVGDTRLFISPLALQLLPSVWGDECVSLVQSFFGTVLELIREGKNQRAERLLRILREPNETHLGLSSGPARGRALGRTSAHEVWGALSNSEAASTGLLQDLEDTILLVEGISVDIVSDIATNIIREPLIQYTQEMCELYGISLDEGVDSGPLWDPKNKRWFSRFERMPVTSEGKLLLVPKGIVRKHLEYDAGEYYRHYLLEHLREVEINANTELVTLLKDGRPRVTKKALIEKYGSGKKAIVRETLKHPQVLERYRNKKRGEKHFPLSHEELASAENSSPPDWDLLLKNVKETKPGNAESSQYEKAVEGLLTALFYPMLSNPKVQHQIHDGRKRIDITYTNYGTEGFFNWLSTHYPAPHVFVECKNYGKEVGNPELDQLSGRFSPSRGKFGLLVCRSFQDKKLFIRRCKDTASDDRGFIVPLDDQDLENLVEIRKEDPLFSNLKLLQDRFQILVS